MSSIITSKDKNEITHIFTDKYYKLVHLSNEYVLSLILDIFRKTSILLHISSDFYSVEDIIADLNFIPQAKIPLGWMLFYLNEFGFLEKKYIDDISYFRITKNLPDMVPDKINETMLKIDKNVLPSNMLLKKAAEGYPDFFRGNKNAIDILFTSDKMKLWTDYFNNSNSGYVVYNSLATLGLAKWMPAAGKIRILEIGGGTGSAAVLFLKEMQLRNLINRIEEYIFSDISPIMLRVGNIKMMEELTNAQMIQLKTLDFNKPFSSQGIRPDSFDVVYGVNSVHAAENLSVTMESIYRVLKPNGIAVLSECVRSAPDSLLFQELIFNMIDNYRNVKLSELRPTPGFLDSESWKKIFIKAKFKNTEILTNADSDKRTCHDRDHRVFAMVIKGEKQI